MANVIRRPMLLLAALSLLSSAGCYYDDGPFISIRSTKGRIANTWSFEYVEKLGLDITDQYKDAKLVLARDGALILEFSPDSIGMGTWSLSFDRKILQFIYELDGKQYDNAFVIWRLKDDEMWLQEEIGDAVRYELKS